MRGIRVRPNRLIFHVVMVSDEKIPVMYMQELLNHKKNAIKIYTETTIEKQMVANNIDMIIRIV